MLRLCLVGAHHTTVSSLVFLSSSAKLVPLKSTTVTLLLLVCADLAAVARACRVKQRLSAFCYDKTPCMQAELPVSTHLISMVLHRAAQQHCAVQTLQVLPAGFRFTGCFSCCSLSWCMPYRRKCSVHADSAKCTSTSSAAAQMVFSSLSHLPRCESRT